MTQAGFQVGRLIREKALDVYVTHTQPAACSASADICRKAKAANVSFGIPRGKLAQCASACTFILAAGSVRSAGPSSLVGVHRSGYLDQNGKPLPREAPASVFKQIGSYFSEIGMTGALMVKLQATPFTNMYWLSPNELLESRLVTQTRSGEQLITGDEHDDWIVVSPKAIRWSRGPRRRRAPHGNDVRRFMANPGQPRPGAPLASARFRIDRAVSTRVGMRHVQDPIQSILQRRASVGLRARGHRRRTDLSAGRARAGGGRRGGPPSHRPTKGTRWSSASLRTAARSSSVE